MGLADSKIPVCISNIAQKSLHPAFSLPYEGRLPRDIIVEENRKTCYNNGRRVTLYNHQREGESPVCGRYYIAEDDLSDELSQMIDELNRKDHPRVPPAVQIRHPHRRPHLAGWSSRRA